MSQLKQLASEWFSNQAYELFEQYSERKIDRITLNKEMLRATIDAIDIEKSNIIHAYNTGMDRNFIYPIQFASELKKTKGQIFYENNFINL
jgi:hypothetical protein